MRALPSVAALCGQKYSHTASRVAAVLDGLGPRGYPRRTLDAGTGRYVRAIGSDLHMDYTAVGQTTHLAARMEQFASPGSILLAPSTLELVEGFVAVKVTELRAPDEMRLHWLSHRDDGVDEKLDLIDIETCRQPVLGEAARGFVFERQRDVGNRRHRATSRRAFDLQGSAGSARTRLQAAVGPGLTRFVARDGELEQLRRAHQPAGNGHGQVAAIVGEAGVGTSRLLYEFTHSSVSYGRATAYLPVIELLRGYLAIESRNDPRKVREKVTRGRS